MRNGESDRAAIGASASGSLLSRGSTLRPDATMSASGQASHVLAADYAVANALVPSELRASLIGVAHASPFGKEPSRKWLWHSRHSRSGIARSTVIAEIEFNWRVLMWWPDSG